jgi:hypothetical protein
LRQRLLKDNQAQPRYERIHRAPQAKLTVDPRWRRPRKVVHKVHEDSGKEGCDSSLIAKQKREHFERLVFLFLSRSESQETHEAKNVLFLFIRLLINRRRD